MNTIEQNIKNAHYILPEVAAPVAKYLPYVKIDNRIIVSGQISRDETGNLIVGKAGENCDIQTAAHAAHRCALYLVAIAKQACDGDLSKIKKVVKLSGFVNSTPDFKDHPQIVNGASETMVTIFGDDIGMHARAAVGMSSLPLGVVVEIEAEFSI